MPQIDNTTFFPQVLNSFFIILIFFVIIFKNISILISSLVKLRVRLLSLTNYEYTFKPFIKTINSKYCFNFFQIYLNNFKLKLKFLSN